MGYLVPAPPPPPGHYRCTFCGTAYIGHVVTCTQCGSVAFESYVPSPPARANSPSDAPRAKPPRMPAPDNSTDRK